MLKGDGVIDEAGGTLFCDFQQYRPEHAGPAVFGRQIRDQGLAGGLAELLAELLESWPHWVRPGRLRWEGLSGSRKRHGVIQQLFRVLVIQSSQLFPHPA